MVNQRVLVIQVHGSVLSEIESVQTRKSFEKFIKDKDITRVLIDNSEGAGK